MLRHVTPIAIRRRRPRVNFLEIVPQHRVKRMQDAVRGGGRRENEAVTLMQQQLKFMTDADATAARSSREISPHPANFARPSEVLLAEFTRSGGRRRA